MPARRLPIAIACALIFPGAAFAGVDLNAFQQHAAAQAGYFSPPSAPATPPPSTASVPPPLPSAVPNTVPGATVPGANATGFSSAPTPPVNPAAAQIVAHAATSAAPHNSPLPPPLPAATVNSNAALSAQVPEPAYASPSPAKIPDVSLASIRAHADMIQTHQIYLKPHSTKNIALDVSGYAPNILVTPFHHPVSASSQVATKYHLYTVQALGSRLVFSLSPHYPVGIFLSGRNPADPAYTFTLIPKDIPGREYILHIPHWRPNPPVSAQVSTSQRNRDLTDVMVAAAKGEIPSGFSRSRHLPPTLLFDGARITPYARFVGLRYALTEYHVRNLGSQPLRLNPTHFYHSGVLAVAFYPDNRLYGHGRTTLFLITHRTPKQGNFIGFVGRGG